MRDSNWLIRDGMDRERMLDMDRRIRPARKASFAVLALALTLLLVVSLAIDPGAVIREPPIVIAPAALIVAVTLLSTALMRSDVEFRNRAVLDELTGMVNRSALATRVSELTHGHAGGNAVLTDVAYAMRKVLRAYDLAYRLGGEEFLVLVPGAEQSHVDALAEQLRAAVEAEPLAGRLRVTIRCGVAASEAGEALDYPALFALADDRLHRAKHAGRNQVCSAAEAATRIPA